MKELFRLHGILDEAELFQALRVIARQQSCSRLCRETLSTKYRNIFQSWVDPSGRPAPYKTFSKLMLEVLREFDSDEDVQADVMWAFICTLRNGNIAWVHPAGSRKHAQLLPHGKGSGSEMETPIADLIQELFDIQDLNGNGKLEESEVIQLNKKIAQLHYGQHADLEAVAVKFTAVFREGLNTSGGPVSRQSALAQLGRMVLLSSLHNMFFPHLQTWRRAFRRRFPVSVQRGQYRGRVRSQTKQSCFVRRRCFAMSVKGSSIHWQQQYAAASASGSSRCGSSIAL